jgi:hypothetical protein
MKVLLLVGALVFLPLAAHAADAPETTDDFVNQEAALINKGIQSDIMPSDHEPNPLQCDDPRTPPKIISGLKEIWGLTVLSVDKTWEDAVTMTGHIRCRANVYTTIGSLQISYEWIAHISAGQTMDYLALQYFADQHDIQRPPK